jgi:hypothetical protein
MLKIARLAAWCLILVILAGFSCRREETHEERRYRIWKEDFKGCDKFAHDRRQAREFLAYNPEDNLKSFEEKRAESRERFENLDAIMEETMRVWNEDRRRCLRGEGWKDEWIDELTEKDRQMATEREQRPPVNLKR